MSKGLGASYVQRMRRWHVPKIKNPRDRISVICDRAFYHDGSFKFKLPRFYKDRFYRKKFPCDARIWNNKKKIYENKVVYRYMSKNLLALQMQVEVRNRVLADFDKKVTAKRLQCPSLSDTEIYLEVTRDEVSARISRRKDIYSKMSRFYNYNRYKHKDF